MTGSDRELHSITPVGAQMGAALETMQYSTRKALLQFVRMAGYVCKVFNCCKPRLIPVLPLLSADRGSHLVVFPTWLS